MTFPLYVYGVSLRGIPVQVNALATLLFLVAVDRRRPRLWSSSAGPSGWRRCGPSRKPRRPGGA